MRFLLLAIWAIPVYAQAPEAAIVISPAERDKIARQFEQMQDMLETLAKKYKHCQSAHRT